MKGIRTFEKNLIDLTLGDQVTITITDATATDKGQDFVDNLRNRRNDSGWATTGSNDAALTEILVEFGGEVELDTIALLVHNLKTYTIQYWTGSAYADFSTAINVSGNTDDVSIHEFVAVSTTKCKIVISGCIVTNADKTIAQLIFTRRIHEFTHNIGVREFRLSKNRKLLKTDSGKGKVMRSDGAVVFRFESDHVTNEQDLAMWAALHDYHDGFLVWLCGGSKDQFIGNNPRIGWRTRDFYLMNLITELDVSYEDGVYVYGNRIQGDLIEVI